MPFRHMFELLKAMIVQYWRRQYHVAERIFERFDKEIPFHVERLIV